MPYYHKIIQTRANLVGYRQKELNVEAYRYFTRMDVRKWLLHTNRKLKKVQNRTELERTEKKIRTHINKMGDIEKVWQRDKFSRQGRCNFRCSMSAKDRAFSYWWRIHRAPLRLMLWNKKLPFFNKDIYQRRPRNLYNYGGLRLY